jgi:hypothetical protein
MLLLIFNSAYNKQKPVDFVQFLKEDNRKAIRPFKFEVRVAMT